MTDFSLCIRIPTDVDIEILLDIEKSISTCSEVDSMISIEGIMFFWYQLIVSKGNEYETFVEHEYFISNYIGSLPSDMRSVILSQIDTFEVSIVDWETNSVLNSPQISLLCDSVNIDGDDYEYTLPPGGDFIEHNSELFCSYDWDR